MVAGIAREDYGDLVAEGLKPTLDDFDRLNQLALRLEAGPETTCANHPRIGWAGDIPFYEPTAAAIMWLNDYAARVPADAETFATFYYFACAHGRDPQTLMALVTPEAIAKAVKGWLRKLPVTEREIARACHYAAWGYDDARAPASPRKLARLEKTGKTEEMENLERLEKIMAEAMGKCGMTYLELLAQTPSRLNAMVLEADIGAGCTVSRDMAKAQVDYSLALNEIRERLIKEREHGRE
jgi:hypothetical protein